MHHIFNFFRIKETLIILDSNVPSDSESGDFYVPNNYNAVKIVMSDVKVPTQTPDTRSTPTLAPTSSPTPAVSKSPHRIQLRALRLNIHSRKTT